MAGNHIWNGVDLLPHPSYDTVDAFAYQCIRAFVAEFKFNGYPK